MKCELCSQPDAIRVKDPLGNRDALLCERCFVQLREVARKGQPICPFKFKEKFWPDVTFYAQQCDIIESVIHNDETIVVAGNKLGKDFVAGYICVYWFLTGGGRGYDVQTRVVTTSVKADHLDVLWGEIHQFIISCKTPLDEKRGGPLIVNQMEIKKRIPAKGGPPCPKSYIKGMVAGDNMEALAGHHAPATLGVFDEASGVHDLAYEKFQGWAKRMLIFGNPHQCSNFFRRAVKAGDLIDTTEAA